MDNRKEFIEYSPKWCQLIETKQILYFDIVKKHNNNKNDFIDFISTIINLFHILKSYINYEFFQYKDITDKKHQKYTLDQLWFFLWWIYPLLRSSYEIMIDRLFEKNHEDKFSQSEKYKKIIKKYPDLEEHKIFSDPDYKRIFSYDLISKLHKLYDHDTNRKIKIEKIHQIYKKRNTIHTWESTTHETIDEVINEILDDLDILVKSWIELYYTYNK